MVDEMYFFENGRILGKYIKGSQLSFDLDSTFCAPADLTKS